MSLIHLFRAMNSKFTENRQQTICATLEQNVMGALKSKLPEPTPIYFLCRRSARLPKKIVGAFMDKAEEGGGLLEIPCGRIKTVMALKSYRVRK